MPSQRSNQQSKALLQVLATCPLLLVSARAEKITYDDHILPIFEQSCTNCHNPDKKKGDLDLSSYPGTMAGGSSGKIAIPGDGGSSRLFVVVTHLEEPVMPPEGDKLEKKQADLIRAWIDGGLLETKSSTARKVERPKIALAVNIDPASKPEGPPPMPENLSLEPPVVGIRPGIVKDMASSPWAPLLAVTGQQQVLLYNTDTLRLAGILPFPAGYPETLDFHPTGRYLLAGGGIPGKSGSTITWEVKTGKEALIAGKEFDSVIAAGLRPDLGGVTTGGPSRLVKLWDTQTGEQSKSIKKHTDWVTSLAYSPDGILLATAGRGGGAYVWEAATGNEFHTLRAHKKGITSVAWRSDSNVLATASEDGDVIFWEMNDGKQVKKIQAHGSGVLAFDYARDGHFVTSGRDKRVKIWKPDFTLKKELPAFSELVVEVAFSHDGKRLFTADFNGKLEAWDTGSFQKIGELNVNPPRIADRLAWIEKEIAAHPAKIKAAEDKFKATEAAIAQASKAHQDAVAGRDAVKKRIAALQQERERLAAEAKQLAERKSQLAGPRQERQKALEVAENTLNDRQQALDEARREAARITPDIKPGAEQEQLAAEAAKARIAELEEQFTGGEATVAAARKKLTATTMEWNTMETRRNEVAARQKAIGPELEAVKKKLPALETAIKPAQESLDAREKELPPRKQALDAARNRHAALAKDLKFWKAAAINTEVRSTSSEHETLKRQQDAALADSRELTEALAKLQEELAAKKQLEEKLKASTAELDALRKEIGARAPKLEELGKKAADLKARYAELQQ